MIKEVKNILIVSLNDNFSKKVASFLAEELDMLSADCHELIVYDLINPKEVLEKCGIEYFKKREKGVLKSCSQYENATISINFDLYYEYKNLFDKSLIFYINLPYEKLTKAPDIIDFENRNKFLQANCDSVIKIDKKSCNFAVKQIIEKMGEMYENC